MGGGGKLAPLTPSNGYPGPHLPLSWPCRNSCAALVVAEPTCLIIQWGMTSKIQ